jgi:hypothetical protein
MFVFCAKKLLSLALHFDVGLLILFDKIKFKDLNTVP